jgi:hypothetical protein
MPCENCGHTVHNLGLSDGCKRTFWCPRCGAIKTEFDVTVTDDYGGSKREVRCETEAPRWTRPADGVPDTLRLLYFVGHLRSGFDPKVFDEMVEYIRSRTGELAEAREKVRLSR